MRRRRAPKREILPDPKFGSTLVAKFINKLMWDGKKSKAQKIFYEALDIISQRIKNEDPLEVFKQAINNVRPILEVRPRRVGGATYQIPMEVRPERSISLAMKWIIEFARARKGAPMSERLAQEIIDAYRGEGASIKKKEDTHKMAEANRAFAHYRW
ncbi:MAG TPA: 30S ribosomal protein S7 [bacterium]|nr:30S ribosomal protein S7 [bacterium]HEX68576.1 30S ribosomal protein S7 [bacterium]